MTQPTPSAVRGAPSAATDAYVINLCASTTPMALSRPTAPELARFTFFVSRRREDGRERFRLHMGYFATRDEAEQLLSLIRDLYPAAWVGEAPGKRLAQRAAAASADASGTREAGKAPAPAPAPPAATAKPAAAVTPAVATKPAATRTAAAMAKPAPAPGPAGGAVTPRTAPAAAPAAARARPAAPAPRMPPSNVREVIQSLDASPAAPPAAASAAAPPARASAAPPASAAGAATAGRAPAPKRDELSDSQVLRILETRRANAVAQPATSAEPRAATDIRMLSPDDTQTWRDIKSQLSRDAAVQFAVQLEWSVAPIDLDRVPALAIFNAYTLYKIEGNREGRKWYGLRLGFFSDAVAARQVAMYVRSEFATVAVVPVSGKERTDATQVGAIELSRPAAPVARAADDAIELIDDVDAALSRSQQPSLELEADVARASVAAEPVDPAQVAPRRQGRPRGSPQTLEETLEILGASQLSIDNGKGVRLDLGNGQRRSEPRNSTFSKLLDRLSEKLRG